LILGLVSSFAYAKIDVDKVDWARYSEDIKNGLKSENQGVKFSAMHNLIKYSEYLDVSNKSAAIEVMKEFKRNNNEPLRRLALIALYKMNNEWAMYSLKSQYKFEENASIKNAMAAVITAYQEKESEGIE